MKILEWEWRTSRNTAESICIPPHYILIITRVDCINVNEILTTYSLDVSHWSPKFGFYIQAPQWRCKTSGSVQASADPLACFHNDVDVDATLQAAIRPYGRLSSHKIEVYGRIEPEPIDTDLEGYIINL